MKSQSVGKQKSWVRSLFFRDRWSFLMTLVGSLAVLIATLYPFNFTAEGVTLKSAARGFFGSYSDLRDLVGNLLLLMPYGFGIASELRYRSVSKKYVLAIALALSASLSLGVETLQIFLPSRTSSWIDICNNSISGILGALVYLGWEAFFARQSSFLATFIERNLTRRVLAIALITWVIFSCSVCFGLQQAALLTNWDFEFPLLIGNERTGDRPWKGKVSQLQISDRAIPRSDFSAVLSGKSKLPSLVADYAIASGNYQDRAGNLANLVWQGKQPSSGFETSENSWLATGEDAIALANRLTKTSQFTIYATIATSETKQDGPARIISMSRDSWERNFTLGQENSDLIFRLRTPITGENGTFTALYVPEVFADTKPHQIIVSYQNSFLNVIVDRADNIHTLELIPKLTLFRYIIPFENQVFGFSKRALFFYTSVFYSLFFIPLGFILALICNRVKGGFKFQLLLFFSGIVIPSLLVELLMYRNYIEIEDFIISISIGLITFVLVKNRLNYQFQ